jgi:hypothetical protein
MAAVACVERIGALPRSYFKAFQIRFVVLMAG